MAQCQEGLLVYGYVYVHAMCACMQCVRACCTCMRVNGLSGLLALHVHKCWDNILSGIVTTPIL